MGAIVIDVTNDNEIEPAVTVEIEKASGGSPAGTAQAAFLGGVAKRPVALIEKQLDAAVLSDKHVRPTIVIDVADRHAHVEAGDAQTGFFGHVLKAAVGKLLKELIARRGIGSAVLHQVDVEQAVVVEIKKRGAGAHDLRHEVAADRSGVVGEVEANLLGHIREPGVVLSEFIARLLARPQARPRPPSGHSDTR